MTVKITWLGHSAFLVEGEERILIDPFLTGNPAAPIKPEDVGADVICVTHGHGDHLGDAIPIAKRLGVPVVAIYELAQYISGKGAEAVGMNFGGTLHREKSSITMVSAVHSSGITEAGFKIDGGLPGGFVISMDGHSIYHAGDTSLFSDMKLIGELYKPDIAMLPIGDLYTMNPYTASIAAEWLGAETVMPMHYNTWPLIEQDPESFKRMLEGKANVIIPVPGRPVTID